MSDLGELLKKAREERGYTLDDVQDLTKIRNRYLEAIEEGNYKVLPGSFYVRAFVKNYAETVGLDAEEVLRLYQNEIPSSVPETAVEQPMMKPRRASSRTSDRVSKWGFTLLMWSFVIVIAVILYVFVINKDFGRDNKTADNGTRITEDNNPIATDPAADNGAANNGADNTGKDASEPDTSPVQEPPAPVPTVTFVEKISSSTDRYQVTPAAGPHKYEITVTGSDPSWIELHKDSSKGKSIHGKTEKSGTVVSYDVEGPVWINVGRADSVEIKVDGQLLDDGNQPSPKRFQVDPADAAGGNGAAAGTSGSTNTGTQ